jgi:glycosyltransferase involved in cell wall biosynthesis
MEENDFKAYLPHWKVALNPSNQNFHNKLIRAMAINNRVDVISIRPFSKTMCDIKKLPAYNKTIDSISWHYIEINRSRFKKIINGQTHVNRLVNSLIQDDTIVVIDTINPAVVHFAKNALKGRKNPIIGVCTDSPSNISGTNRSYTTYLLKSAQVLSGTIALTDELNDLFNPNKKPSLIMEGIVEKPAKIEKTDAIKPYFYFGGALMKQYGIYQLIEAFNEINLDYPDLQLYVAGHHANYDELNKVINNNKNVHLLGLLSLDKVYGYERESVANINPRPFSEDLDRFSIPSKTIEYLTSGVPTISVKNTKLQKIFSEEIVWAKSASKDDLKDAMIKVLTQTEEQRKAYSEAAKSKVYELYSLNAINKRLNLFFDDIIK